MMSADLRVLIVEDRPSDAELMVHQLRQAGFEPVWQRVEDEQAYLDHLDSTLDLILADHCLPRFGALRALHLLRERGLDIPLILVSGTVDQELGLKYVREGAADYVFKDRLARLGPAVARTLAHGRVSAERRLARQALQARERAFLVLHELAVASSGLLAPAALAQLVVDRARDLLAADSAGLYWWDAEAGVLRPLGENDPDRGAPDRGVIPGHGAVGVAFQRGEPVVVADYATWEHVTPWGMAHGVRSGLAVPLLVGDRAVGALGIRSYVHRQFEPEQVQLLTLLAAQVGPALEAARLHAEAEQRRVEAEALADLARQGAAERDSQRVIGLICERACRLLGADYAGVVLRDPEGYFTWQGMWGNRSDVWRTRYIARGSGPAGEALAAGHTVIVERLGERSDYSPAMLPVQCSEGGRTVLATPLRGREGLQGALVLGWRTDITPTAAQVRLAEALAGYAATILDNAQAHATLAVRAAELAASEARVRTLYEAVACGVLVWDTHGAVVDANVAAQEILGLPLGQIRGRTAEALWRARREDGSELPDEERPYAIALRTRRLVRHATVPVVLRNGEQRWFQAEAVPVLGEDGEPVQVVSSLIDITEHKRAVQERASLNAQLQRSLQELLALYEAGQVLGASLEPKEVASRVLEVATRISGLEVGSISLVPRGTGLRAWQTTGAVETFQMMQHSPAARRARRTALLGASPTYYHLEPVLGGTEVLAGWCFPLRARDWVIGVLDVCGPEAAACRAPVDVLGSLANQAASALENARLYREGAEREQRLQELVKRLLLAQETERRRVAYDVHDGLAQVVTGAQLSLETLAAHYHPRSPRARQELERALELARRAVKDARRVIADLRPTALDEFGLATALRLEVEALQAEGWEITFDDGLGAARLAPTIETALFRVAQEALANVRRHAHASRVHVALQCQDDTLRLEVRDWGRGFRPSRLSTTSGPGERVGLPSMHERAALLGGRCTVRSRPGGGTRIVVEVPVSPRAVRGRP